MMSASSSGSFHSSLYLLAVSMTLAAVYLWGAEGVLWPGLGSGPTEGQPLPLPELPNRIPATHRLMELRRREPDFRFRVVQMMRSVNRKRDRSFLPPTAFCGDRCRIQAQRPTLLPTVPKGTARPREGEGSPACPEAEAELGHDPGLLLGWKSRRPVGRSCEQKCGESREVATGGQITGHFLPLQ